MLRLRTGVMSLGPLHAMSRCRPNKWKEMAVIRLNKEDLRVDNVHTSFGLTKLS